MPLAISSSANIFSLSLPSALLPSPKRLGLWPDKHPWVGAEGDSEPERVKNNAMSMNSKGLWVDCNLIQGAAGVFPLLTEAGCVADGLSVTAAA